MRGRFIAAAISVVAIIGLTAAPALAGNVDTTNNGTLTTNAATGGVTGNVTATVAAVSGGRVFGLVTGTIATTSGANINGAYSVPVVETLAAGANPWEVDASMSDLSRTGGGGTITADHLSAAGATVTNPTGAGTDNTGTGGTFGSGVNLELWNNHGELPANVYTATHTGTGALNINNVPSGTATGAYTGTLTVTLWQ